MHHPPQGHPGFPTPQPWSQPPQPPRRGNGKVWAIALASLFGALIIVAGVGTAGWFYLQRVRPVAPAVTATPTPANIEVAGSITVKDRPRRSGTVCTTGLGYDDISEGAQVTVTDEAGTVLAVGTLGAGVGTSQGCQFPFTVSVPPGRQFYGFEISHRGTIRYTQDQLVHSGVNLSLGD